jgi:hypothetical protein
MPCLNLWLIAALTLLVAATAGAQSRFGAETDKNADGNVTAEELALRLMGR